MTSPSSYEFYHPSNVLRERKEGTQLYRVFITDKKITLYSKIIIRTTKSKVLFEKVIDQKTYSLHNNHKGERFLKCFNRSAGGSITDMSLSLALDKNRIMPSLPEDCNLLIEKNILSWFGDDYVDSTFQEVKEELFFPVLKDDSFPRNIGTSLTLSGMQKKTAKVTEAMRESSSWHEFIINLCPTVHTLNDLDVIKNNSLSALLPIAVMELPPMSALFSIYGDTITHVVNTFDKVDVSLLGFMFKYLSLGDRIIGLDAMMSLTNFHLRSFKENNFYHYSRYELTEKDMSKVPARLRPELARKLLKTLVSIDGSIKDKGQASFKDSYLMTYLTHTFRYWFAQKVMEPQLETVSQTEDLDDRFMELYGIPFPKESPLLEFHEVGRPEEEEALGFYSIKRSQLIIPNPEYHFDKLGSIISLGSPVTERGSGCSYASMNGYVGEDGLFVPVSGELYSIDDIMYMIESGTTKIDSYLIKMGRETTPENRLAFLAFRHKERKFKNSWKYYDLGVTDIDKILALKKANITAKRDILTYMELPDEMFYELTAMAAGVDDLEMANAS